MTAPLTPPPVPMDDIITALGAVIWDAVAGPICCADVRPLGEEGLVTSLTHKDIRRFHFEDPVSW